MLKRPVCAIDEDHRSRDASQYRPRQGPKDTVSFAIQVPIAQQSVHGLYVVFDKGATCAVMAEVDQCDLAALDHRPYDPYQRLNSGLLTDDGVVLQPFVQQARRVHTVRSELRWQSRNHHLRSDDSLHVDFLSGCISYRSSRNSRGYFRSRLWPNPHGYCEPATDK